MGNTVGSLSSLLLNPHDSYILGLWAADRYLRSSSTGLSNTNLTLIRRFSLFLLSRFPKSRVRIRIYGSTKRNVFSGFKKSYCKGFKHKLVAYHIYVNSRPLVRDFFDSLKSRNLLKGSCLFAYFAGRFDGDGSLSKGKRRFFRIVYSNKEDAMEDKILIPRIKTSLYRYEKANTYCLYFSEKTLNKFLKKIKPFSNKLQ